MGILIEIKKEIEKNNIHIYKIILTDKELNENEGIYIGFDPQKKLTYLYLKKNFEKPDIITACNEIPKIADTKLPVGLIIIAMRLGYEAIKRNHFPELLAHQA